MKKELIDGRKARKLTPKQLRFVYEFSNYTLLGKQSATESARKSGYSETVSKKMAYELQDPKKYPLVAEAIQDMKKELKEKYSVSMDKHLSRLEELGRKAEEEKHFSASINAEQLRGKVGGLYDPTIRLESAIENLPRDQLIKKLSELQKKDIPIIGEENIIEVEPEKKEKNKIKLLKE
tara:strand:+ start:608 stop:1144 length:537 start_codon:yes stop_codon:yes gene_type:complete